MRAAEKEKVKRKKKKEVNMGAERKSLRGKAELIEIFHSLLLVLLLEIGAYPQG